MPKKLSADERAAAEARALEYLTTFIRTNGHAPSALEAATALGVSGTTMRTLARELVAQGRLGRGGKSFRTLTLKA
jgi:hypothetical protein